MVVFKARSPVGRAKKGLKGAGQVDESVKHQEEHGQQRGEDVDVAEQDPKLADG